MSLIKENIISIKNELPPGVTLIAVSKKKSAEQILEAYQTGHRDFGENYIQELLTKQPVLPNDINWHFIGHLQSNKVKYIVPFITYIHSVDSEKLLVEINKQAAKNNKIIKVFLQIHIATEETKFGLSYEEADEILKKADEYKYVNIIGVMAMASNTNDENQINKEFYSISQFIKKYNQLVNLCIGMSNDYLIAIKNNATHIRIGSKIFGER